MWSGVIFHVFSLPPPPSVTYPNRSRFLIICHSENVHIGCFYYSRDVFSDNVMYFSLWQYSHEFFTTLLSQNDCLPVLPSHPKICSYCRYGPNCSYSFLSLTNLLISNVKWRLIERLIHINIKLTGSTKIFI